MNLSTGYLLFLVAVFAALSVLLVLPFVQFVLAALLLAYVLHPLGARLERRTSRSVAAFGTVVVAVVAVVLPFVLVGAAVADDAVRLAEGIDPDAVGLADLESLVEDRTGAEVDIAERLAESAQAIASAVLERTTAWIAAFTYFLVGVGLTVFLVYYLVKDGERLLAWIREITPLPGGVQDDLYAELDDVVRAVLVGHVLIAFVEGLLAGAGLFATGVPNAAFWTVVMAVLALIPLVGAFLVWGPASAYLALTGEPVFAVALFVYSAVVVGVADDYLRPLVVDRYADLNPAVIVLGVVGGVYAFGIMGLFFGPVILGAFVATLAVVDEHYGRLADGAD